jgi:hypothetical protein
MEYKTSASNQHRSVQYKQNGQWVNFPYAENGFHPTFNYTSAVSGAKQYKP